MHRFARALGAILVTALVAAGLAVGLAAPAQAGAIGVCPSGQNAGPGTFSGTGDLGLPLTVSEPTWLLPVLSSSVSWLRGATLVGTGTSYTPVAADAGQVVSATQTVGLLGLAECEWPIGSVLVPAIPTDPGGPGDPGDPGGPGDPGDPGDTVLSLVGGLGLPASAEVGQLVVLTDPVWSLPGVTTTYQWLRDGAPIPGADVPFYVPTPDDAGHQLSAAVTGTLLGIPAVTVLTDALDIPLATGSTVSPVGDITVNGTRKIGTTLSLSGPTWDPVDATSKYQWLRDDAPIAGATGPTYTLVPADLGHAVSVKATGHKEGWTDNTITSDPVTPVIGDPIQFVVKPRLTGTGKVGKLLTADPGAWGGAGDDGALPDFTFQWNRDGVVIPGAVAQTYQAQVADAGKAVSVTVKAIRPAFKAGTFTTSSLAIAKIVPKLRAKTAKKTITKGKAVTLALLLKAAGISSPKGAVTVYDGRSVVKKLRFAPGKKGRASVKLGHLKPGVHRLKAVYAGSAALAGATSKVVRLVVKKKRK